MNRIWTIVRLFFKREGFARAAYIKKKNLFGSIGNNCYYHPFIIPVESKMISMGDNVVVAKGVELITHDMSYALLSHDEKLIDDIGPGNYPYFKKGITIGNNVMICANSLIMPGVTIGNRVIVGGGTVITHDIPDGVIVAGVPAKVIGDYIEFAKKRRSNTEWEGNIIESL